MKKVFFRLSLIVFALILLALVPFNADQIFGYTASITTPSCGKDAPNQVVLYEPNHPLLPRATGVGQVRLNWLKVDKANKYTVGFGLSPRNYIYGATNIADTDNFTVNYLVPGVRYYFAVKGVNDCKPGEWSREWSVVVGGGGVRTVSNTQPIVGTRSTNLVPSVRPSQRNVVVPTTASEQVTTEPTRANVVPPLNNPVVEPTPAPSLNFFQRIINFFTGGR